MAYINNINSFLVKSETDIFSPSPLQTSVDNGWYTEFRSVNHVNDSSLEFYVPESSNYLDLSQTQLIVKVKITNQDGTDLPKTNKILLVNNFLSSLFVHLGVELNGKAITPANNNYHLRSYVEKLLNYSTDTKLTHLGSSLFYHDNADDFKTMDGDGFQFRSSQLNEDKTTTLSGFLHTELCNQNRLMLNNVSIRFKFYRNNPMFSLALKEIDDALPTDANEKKKKEEELKKKYNIKILDAKLVMRYVKLSNSVMVSHQLTLNKNLNATYPVNKIEMKTLTLPKGAGTKRLIDNLFLGSLPKVNEIIIIIQLEIN